MDISSEGGYQKKPTIIARPVHIESRSSMDSENSMQTEIDHFNFNTLNEVNSSNQNKSQFRRYSQRSSNKNSPGTNKKVAYKIDAHKLEANPRDPKRSESVMNNVMPPIISLNDKMRNDYLQNQIVPSKGKLVTPINLVPIRVSYQGMHSIDEPRKTNTTMNLKLLKNL